MGDFERGTKKMTGLPTNIIWVIIKVRKTVLTDYGLGVYRIVDGQSYSI